MDTSGMEWLGGAPHCTEERHPSSGGRRKRKRNLPKLLPHSLEGVEHVVWKRTWGPSGARLCPGHPWAPDQASARTWTPSGLGDSLPDLG